MSASGDTPTKSKRFSVTRIVLVISLAVNVAVAGLVIGAVLKHGPRDHDRRPPKSEILSYGPYTSALTEEDREVLLERLVDAQGEIRDNRRAVKADFKRLLNAVRAEPYDPAATAAIMAEQQARVQKQIDLVSRVLLEQLTEMSAEEREEFADRLERVLRRGPPRK
ncbi:periplasmic heavy metal sensor [Rhodovulum sp. FJ3]|uniref:periplasmic heavy metal sensor n=1 Tax=Rhodovulum sp. FJ3 TaxID=3079053 RepID=UPI00293DF2CA|nr:periplasmic heavy metal sensor [Rhodovulum sp. FJ3]MDV4166927.1 periplasmic heavy metal sensor [Rhodovulum sp. FJ3]